MQNTQSRLDGIHQLLGRTPDTTTSPTPADTSSPAAAATPTTTAATPAADSLTTTAAVLAPKPVKSPHPRRGDTALKIHQIVDAMIRWNSSQQDNQHRLRISIPPVKALASAIGANYQPTIQQVFQERESELNELHSRLMLGGLLRSFGEVSADSAQKPNSSVAAGSDRTRFHQNYVRARII